MYYYTYKLNRHIESYMIVTKFNQVLFGGGGLVGRDGSGRLGTTG